MAKDKLQSICHIYKSWHMNSNANNIESKLCNILYRLFSRFAPWKVNSFARCGNGVLDEYKHQNTYCTKKKKFQPCPLGTMQNNISHILINAHRVYGTITLCRNLKNTKITVFLNSKNSITCYINMIWKPGSDTNCW